MHSVTDGRTDIVPLAVMGKILLLKYLKYFTKYSGKKVFKMVF